MQTDIAILGSGFGGSLMAMICRRLGFSVVLVEKGRHPRFAIGESSTPLANLLLEEIALEHNLPQILPLTKWGSWQKSYPELACGLKRGFSFYHHSAGKRFEPREDRQNELLVAASPRDEIADTHWFRADFDAWFVRQAQELGAVHLDGTEISRIDRHETPGGWHEIHLANRPECPKIQARFLIDASGPRGALFRAFGLKESTLPHLPGTQGLFTHFRNVKRFEPPARAEAKPPPPYPPDDAALHHVFEGGWIWALRFNNGLTSVGAAVTDALASELNLKEGAPAWQRLMDRLPSAREQFEEAVPEFPFVHAPRLSFLCGQAGGPNWAMLPSAAGFVDPLLSTGFPLNLLGISRLARVLQAHWQRPSLTGELEAYRQTTIRELLAAENLISALYSRMDDFPVFCQLSLIYFAAASFSETARRLGKPELADSFLLSGHPTLAPAIANICRRARTSPAADNAKLGEEILRLIEPINVAGLTDPARRNHYPALASDLFNSAEKLGASREDIRGLLERCGF